MSTKILENEFQLKDELVSDFFEGIKLPCDFKIGAEIEKVNVLKNNFEAVPYVIIEQFLDIFSSKYGWQKTKNASHTIGLQKDGHIITLEPGSQLELGVAQADNIHQIAAFVEDFNKKAAEISCTLGFYSLGYGIQPVSTFERISIIPKERYSLMTDYFVDKGDMAYVMMRETAGTQVTLDYSSESDAILKLRLGMLLAPVVSAMFSNSPIRGGQKTEYKSFRAKSWLCTDDERCGFVSEKLFNPQYDFGFSDYVDTLLDVPMIFVMRENKPYQVNKTFREYLDEGCDGLVATKDDWQLHSNLFFPEVRLKGFLEFRNADAQRFDMTLALMALYKGLFYDSEAIRQAYEIFDGISFEELQKMRILAPMHALNVEVSGRRILDLAQKSIIIAQNALRRQSASGRGLGDESSYLRILESYLNQGKTPADDILGLFDGDIARIVEYSKV